MVPIIVPINLMAVKVEAAVPTLYNCSDNDDEDALVWNASPLGSTVTRDFSSGKKQRRSRACF